MVRREDIDCRRPRCMHHDGLLLGVGDGAVVPLLETCKGRWIVPIQVLGWPPRAKKVMQTCDPCTTMGSDD